MSKYSALWDHIAASSEEKLLLSYEEIERIAGVPLDHSFLKYKKELTEFGWQVEKISMKAKTVAFKKG